MEMQPGDSHSIDTYANLLYKLGRKDDAINWEQKALSLSPGDPDFTTALSKMKRGEPTWIVPTDGADKK